MLKANTAERTLLAHPRGYVGGEFLPEAPTPLDVRNPCDGSLVASLPSYGGKETLAAVEAAEGVLRGTTTLGDRVRWLKQIAAAHADHREELAQIVTSENGKPIQEARGEVDYAAGFYAQAARVVSHLAPKALAERPKNHDWRVMARPAGVAGLIVPWNFPLAMLAKKAGAALAAGAPIVVKPAEKTPLSSIALFHLLHELDMPKGMVNLVFGDAPAIGKVLCEHPAVRVISFTGSTGVGKLLSAQAAPHIKRMALELGGNAPFVVFEDAKVEEAVDHLMTNKFRCSGQTCVCANRVYVHRAVADRFVGMIKRKILDLVMGPGVKDETQVGPLIDEQGFAKVRELVKDALDKGADAVLGGLPPAASADKGWFYPPTLLDNVSADARCLTEEVFGPVIPIVRFGDEDEVVRAANATTFGLAAYVFTQDAERAERVIGALRFGHVGLNSGTGPTPEVPFGGMKESGLGREGGEEGMLEFVELQAVAAAPK